MSADLSADVAQIAHHLLTDQITRAQAADRSRALITSGRLTGAASAVLHGAALLSAADVYLASGRPRIPLTQIAEWYDNRDADHESTHWWTARLRGVTTDNVFLAESRFADELEADGDALEFFNPEDHYVTDWTPDRVDVITRALSAALPDHSPDDRAVLNATLESMTRWQDWRHERSVERFATAIQRIVDAVVAGDSNALYGGRCNLDLTGTDIDDMIAGIARPAHLLDEALPLARTAFDTDTDARPLTLTLRLRDADNQAWTIHLTAWRTPDGGLAVTFDQVAPTT